MFPRKPTCQGRFFYGRTIQNSVDVSHNPFGWRLLAGKPSCAVDEIHRQPEGYLAVVLVDRLAAWLNAVGVTTPPTHAKERHSCEQPNPL
ncbi:MAG: hypothetical protein QMB14_09555 [Polaromonas sp.]|jgi:hypothetical protein